jgi:hypothetical protein
MTVLRRQRRTVAVPAVLAAAFFSSCGGGSPIVPDPVPTPTAIPTQEPRGPVSCPLGDGLLHAQCARKKRPSLLPYVDTAINALIQRRPEIFDLTREAGTGTHQFLILDREAYLNGIVDNLRAAGVCAERERDLGDYVNVKDSNGFSESYDITLSSGHIRRGAGSYRETCEPAAFPLDPGPDAPPPMSGCGRPYPPAITRFGGKVHLRVGNYWVLDSTAQVGPNPDYCRSIGFKARIYCPVRTEGHPQRGACETWRVGYAQDTGRPGPTWTKPGGGFCTGPESGCQNHPDNQYQLWVFANGAGTYKVCAANGVCGEIPFAP